MLFFAVLACAAPECDSGYMFNTDGLCVVDTRVPADTDTQDTDTQDTDTQDSDTADTGSDTGDTAADSGDSGDSGVFAREERAPGETLGVLFTDVARAFWPW